MDWTSTDHLLPVLRVHYPRTDTSGAPVRLEQNEREGMRQIHALTDDRQSVYFEAVVFGGHLVHRRLLERQIEAFAAPLQRQDPWHSAIDQTVFRDDGAMRMCVGWTEDGRDMSRTMLLFDTPTSTVRLVFDHRSATNGELQDRLEILG